MEFGWINIYGTVIITIMLIPNIIYGIKNKDLENKYNNKLVVILEQIGRYLSMFFTIFPIGIKGFKSIEYIISYLTINSILILLYIIIYTLYFKNKTLKKSILLAVIPTLIFLTCGITLKHLGLIISSIIFGLSHIIITYKNNCKI